MFRILSFLIFIIISLECSAQTLHQNIRGRVIDQQSQEALPFATIVIVGSDPVIGTTTDVDGYFKLNDLPIGRYDIEASFLGYESIIITEVVLSSAKEIVLDLELREHSTSLNEVVIKPRVSKEDPINAMATVSARMLSVEEANRYAGGFDDPARLASSFAGVASSVGNNAIVIRGNAPKFLQWKIEDVEIPNPNHFADLGAFGGGGLTALSSNLLTNSDFLTGAFPAEFNNALSGVFDIKMRSGNNTSFEHSLEVGAIGLDFASEGPISRSSKSSYLFNYRYSTLGLLSSLLPEDAQGTNYQDLSFKIKLPSKKHGIFSLWGIGLLDNSGTIPEMDRDLHYYYQDLEMQDVKQYMGAMGINHRLIISDKAYLNSSLAYTLNGIDLYTERLNAESILQPENKIKISNYNVTLKSFINKKISSKHTNKTGINIRSLGYDMELSESDLIKHGLTSVVNDKGNTFLLTYYTSSSFRLKDWTLNAGLTGQLFTLNNKYTLEPRFGASYQFNEKNKLSFGYGLHSRIEPLNIYFANTINSNQLQENLSLGFTKAHHFVLSYDLNLTDKLHLKIEPYFQQLFDIPIVENSTESLLNLQNDWFINNHYINEGIGQNYGVDLTLEHYIKNGLYFLVSGSIFDSRYKTDQDEWYNTRFNKNYILNGLIGKEFRIGKRQSLLGFNFRVSLQGGDRYSIVDTEASVINKDVVFDESNPFTEQTKPSRVFHFTVNYEWYRKKTSHRISLKILNASNFEEFQGFRYNLKTDEVEEFREALIIPNISYKLSF